MSKYFGTDILYIYGCYMKERGKLLLLWSCPTLVCIKYLMSRVSVTLRSLWATNMSMNTWLKTAAALVVSRAVISSSLSM